MWWSQNKRKTASLRVILVDKIDCRRSKEELSLRHVVGFVAGFTCLQYNPLLVIWFDNLCCIVASVVID